MGNRAVITTKGNWENDGVGVYLHWNGGITSVECFLEYCKLKGYRPPETDCYGWARLCQVIGNFFGGSTSIGIDTIWHLDRDNGDNGTYIIENWEIVDRIYECGYRDDYDTTEFLIAIDKAMPEREQLGEDFIRAEVVAREDIKLGDVIFDTTFDGQVFKANVVGFEKKLVSTNPVTDAMCPVIDRYGKGNGNNILRKPFYRVSSHKE